MYFNIIDTKITLYSLIFYTSFLNIFILRFLVVTIWTPYLYSRNSFNQIPCKVHRLSLPLGFLFVNDGPMREFYQFSKRNGMIVIPHTITYYKYKKAGKNLWNLPPQLIGIDSNLPMFKRNIIIYPY